MKYSVPLKLNKERFVPGKEGCFHFMKGLSVDRDGMSAINKSLFTRVDRFDIAVFQFFLGRLAKSFYLSVSQKHGSDPGDDAIHIQVCHSG